MRSEAAQLIRNRCPFKQSLQHATAATVLQTLVRRQAVLRAVASVAELAHIQRVRLLVLVLEVTLQRVVTGEGAMAVRTFLRLVDASTGGWRHSQYSLFSIAATLGATVAADLRMHVSIAARWTQVIVAAAGAVRRLLLGTDRFRRGRCGRVNAVDSCGSEKGEKRSIRLSCFLDR